MRIDRATGLLLMAWSAACADEGGKLPDAVPPDVQQVCNDPIPSEGHCLDATIARFGATATLIPRCGWIVVVGGAELGQGMIGYPRIVELYEPKAERIRVVAELRAGGARGFHTATLLDEGRVLIAGGESHLGFANTSLRTAFIIDAHDPEDVQVESDQLAMRLDRTGHTATRLPDGRVLIVGGRQLAPQAARPQDHLYLASMEFYDPQTRAFSTVVDAAGDPVALSAARWGHSSTLLPSGDVLVTGGADAPAPFADLLRISGATIQVEALSMNSEAGRFFHTASLASGGAVALAGGYPTLVDADVRLGWGQNPVDAFEMWSPSANDFEKSCATSMTTARAGHSMHAAPNRFAMVGGVDAGGTASNSIEWLSESCAPMASETMCTARAWHSAVEVPSAKALIMIGGRKPTADPFGESVRGVELIPLP